MTNYATASSGDPWDIRSSRPVELICFALCVAQAAYLAASFVHGLWLIDADGRGIPTDFVNVWAAGRLVLDGRPEAAYDWTIHKAVENAVIGYAFEGYFAWLYPPPFLFVAALLASLPFAAAQVLWSLLTFPVYLAAIRLIIGDRIAILFACAFPAVLPNFVVGQNGFVSAALLGGALGFMERRPLIAGCFLGLLTYKPHLGILFPIVLVASGRWHVFWAAAAVATVVNLTSWAAFGTSTWLAFIHSLPGASQAILTEGQADWNKLQSLFGIVRSIGGSEGLAWSMQGGSIAVVAVLLCAAWRARIPFELKAAALATGTLLATPYLYLYDLVALAVPMAFLIRIGLRTGFLRGEVVGFGASSLLIFVFPLVKVPLGPPAILIIAGLIARRTLLQRQANARVRPAFAR
jgi:arabinofuranan 3-O-arabinosyltransferase